MKTKMKTKMKMKNKMKTKTKMKMKFSFWFLFLLFKSFCIFVNSTWPRGAIDGQLSLDWPRSTIALLLNKYGLKEPQTVNSLLLDLEVL